MARGARIATRRIPAYRVERLGSRLEGTMGWIDACAADDILAEDVTRFDHAGRTFAIYRTRDDCYFATDGLCTHEQVHLADGFVMGNVIECPNHNGRFDFTPGVAKGASACVNLATCRVEFE